MDRAALRKAIDKHRADHVKRFEQREKDHAAMVKRHAEERRKQHERHSKVREKLYAELLKKHGAGSTLHDNPRSPK